MARHAGATRAADAVDVILGVDRHVEIEHVAQAADVDAAGGHVAADQQAQLIRFELGQRCEAFRLAHVTMQRADAEAVPLERLVENVHVALPVAEDQRVLNIVRLDEAAQRLALVEIIHDRKPGDDRRGNARRTADRYFLRLTQESVGQTADFGRHRRTEEQRLTTLRQEADDLLDIGDEAHVEHAVGLVDHQQAGVVQHQTAALEQVHQPTRRRDQHVDAAHQRFLLIVHALAADQQRVGQLQILAILNEVFGDLQREFASRLEDQAARHACAGPCAGQDVEHRQHEATGLASAGLRGAEHVATHENARNGLRLDRSRLTIALLADGADDFRRQAETLEAVLVGFLLGDHRLVSRDRCIDGRFMEKIVGRLGGSFYGYFNGFRSADQLVGRRFVGMCVGFRGRGYGVHQASCLIRMRAAERRHWRNARQTHAFLCRISVNRI